MRSWALVASIPMLAACASTYNLPEAERSRGYDASEAAVWEAVLAAVNDIGLAVVETEPDHSRVKARAGGTVWDLKGHVLVVIIGEEDDGLVRVDANVENVSDQVVDFGESQRLLRRYLQALDRRLL